MKHNPLNLKHMDFGGLIDLKKLDTVEKRILFVLFQAEERYNLDELTTTQIFEILNRKLRKKTSLSAIKMAIKRSGNKISSIIKGRQAYHQIMVEGKEIVEKIIGKTKPKEINDLVIPNEVVETEKRFYKKVIWQINGCYGDEYYDACFVMIRRAIETLIIDVYEHLSIEDEIKNQEGEYLPFSKLIDGLLANSKIKISKIAKRDLKAIKKFGDTAAHNRKLNLKKADIDKYSDSVRLIIEELINHKI